MNKNIKMLTELESELQKELFAIKKVIDILKVKGNVPDKQFGISVVAAKRKAKIKAESKAKSKRINVNLIRDAIQDNFCNKDFMVRDIRVYVNLSSRQISHALYNLCYKKELEVVNHGGMNGKNTYRSLG